MRCQVLGDSVLVNSLFVLAQAGALDFGALIDLGNDSAAINITIGELVQPGAEWKPHWRERVAGGGGPLGGGDFGGVAKRHYHWRQIGCASCVLFV